MPSQVGKFCWNERRGRAGCVESESWTCDSSRGSISCNDRWPRSSGTGNWCHMNCGSIFVLVTVFWTQGSASLVVAMGRKYCGLSMLVPQIYCTDKNKKLASTFIKGIK